MPELPEVETVRRGMEPVVTGQIITDLKINRYDLRFPMPSDFSGHVRGQKILSVGRRGKFLLIGLENDQHIIMHLGMSGQMKIIPADFLYSEVKHDHVIFKLGDGTRVVFHDPRRFGSVLLHQGNDVNDHKFFSSMGPEPLSNYFHADYLYDAIKNRNSAIKQILLDQRIVAGLGNIYVSEALYMAGIHPKRKASQISKPRCEVLVPCIIKVLHKAIKAGGSSLKDYKKTDGSLGYFQHSFSVYGRENEPCKTCDSQIAKIVQSARSTYYCKQCQS